MRVLVPSLCTLLMFLGACAGPGATTPVASGGTDVRWEPVVVHEGEAFFERVRAGRPDPADPNLQLVGVDQAGNVVLVHFDPVAPRSTVLHRQGAEMTGLVVADVDPSVPGEEIYAGGYAGGDLEKGIGGVVLQVVVTPEGPRVRRIWEGSAYVHSIEVVPPQRAGDPRRLLFGTYAGELRLLTPTTGGRPWADALLFRDTGTTEPEALKVKDAAFLRDPSGRTPHEVLVASKTGRTFLVDLERPADARLVHTEEGGLSRVEADPSGGAYLTGYWGRVLHLVRDGAGFRVDVLAHEGRESGLRGVVQGRFPGPGGPAPLAIFGYHALCRTLTPRLGAWDTTTVYRDSARGHSLTAVDLVPGNDADELVVAGQSKRITVLIAR